LKIDELLSVKVRKGLSRYVKGFIKIAQLVCFTHFIDWGQKYDDKKHEFVDDIECWKYAYKHWNCKDHIVW